FRRTEPRLDRSPAPRPGHIRDRLYTFSRASWLRRVDTLARSLPCACARRAPPPSRRAGPALPPGATAGVGLALAPPGRRLVAAAGTDRSAPGVGTGGHRRSRGDARAPERQPRTSQPNGPDPPVPHRSRLDRAARVDRARGAAGRAPLRYHSGPEL